MEKDTCRGNNYDQYNENDKRYFISSNAESIIESLDMYLLIN